MSILVKGIKVLPKHCLECMFYRTKGQDYDYCCISSVVPKNYVPNDCPLIELPDHGDLIDRDVVVARLADWSKRLIETYGENDEYVKCLSEVLEGLGCDDVIVPAERSAKVCPLHSDDEVTEYCLEGPCMDEMEGRCPIAERSEDEHTD